MLPLAQGPVGGPPLLCVAHLCFALTRGLCWDVSGSLGDAGVASWPPGAGSSVESEPRLGGVVALRFPPLGNTLGCWVCPQAPGQRPQTSEEETHELRDT